MSQEDEKDYVIGAQPVADCDDPEGVLDYFRFLELLRHPQASDFHTTLRNFVSAFLDRPIPVEDYTTLVRQSMQALQEKMKAHKVWADLPPEQITPMIDGLEKFVMLKINTKVFGKSTNDIERDKLLSTKCHKLRQFIQPKHLEIPKIDFNFAPWSSAQHELQRLGMFGAPRDKLSCIVACCDAVNRSLCEARNSQSPPGADEFLPVLIFVVITTHIDNLASSLSYVCSYRRSEAIVGKASYFLTQLFSAVAFIERMDSTSLCIDPIDYDVWMGQDEEPSNTDTTTTTTKSTSKPNPPQQIRSYEGENPTFRFEGVEFEDLTLSDLPALVGEYQALRKAIVREIRASGIAPPTPTPPPTSLPPAPTPLLVLD